MEQRAGNASLLFFSHAFAFSLLFREFLPCFSQSNTNISLLLHSKSSNHGGEGTNERKSGIFWLLGARDKLTLQNFVSLPMT